MHRYIGTSDAQSTGNMRKHVKKCWGEEALSRADSIKNADEARVQLGGAGLKDGSITAAFERSGKGKVRYSHRQHTKAEIK